MGAFANGGGSGGVRLEFNLRLVRLHTCTRLLTSCELRAAGSFGAEEHVDGLIGCVDLI